jgi:hypothetical protein
MACHSGSPNADAIKEKSSNFIPLRSQNFRDWMGAFRWADGIQLARCAMIWFRPERFAEYIA